MCDTSYCVLVPLLQSPRREGRVGVPRGERRLMGSGYHQCVFSLSLSPKTSDFDPLPLTDLPSLHIILLPHRRPPSRVRTDPAPVRLGFIAQHLRRDLPHPPLWRQD